MRDHIGGGILCLVVLVCVTLGSCVVSDTNVTLDNVCDWSKWSSWNCTCCGSDVQQRFLAFRTRAVCCLKDDTTEVCLLNCGFHQNMAIKHNRCSSVCPYKTGNSVCLNREGNTKQSVDAFEDEDRYSESSYHNYSSEMYTDEDESGATLEPMDCSCCCRKHSRVPFISTISGLVVLAILTCMGCLIHKVCKRNRTHRQRVANVIGRTLKQQL